MKKIFVIAAIMFLFVCVFTSCDMLPLPLPQEKEDVITVEGGYLVVNGVKTEYKVKNENHTFSEWELYNEDEIDCEKKLYYRVCSDCATLEWKEGEHLYTDVYLVNLSLHWKECTICKITTEKGSHIAEDNGRCSVCDLSLSTTEGIVYDISADGTYAEVLGYNGTDTKIAIADTYQGLPVTTIYNGAFENKTFITTVIIPESVITIEANAFSGCSQLKNIVLGNNITTIKNFAFAKCAIISINIPDNVKSIGEHAFMDCKSLTSVNIGSGVASIGKETFAQCTNLTDVIISDNVIYIGESAFSGCRSLTSIVIPDNVTSISNRAFYGCSSLKSIVIPDSTIYIGREAFANCDSAYTEYKYGKYIGNEDNPYLVLVEITNKTWSTYEIHENTKIIAGAFENCTRLSNIVIPNSVTVICNMTFAYCGNLRSVTFPESVTSIGDNAFSNCDNLTSLSLPDGITSIGSYSFGDCDNLTSLTIPVSVTSMGNDVFKDSRNLMNIKYRGTQEQWNTISIRNLYAPDNCKITYNYTGE